MTDPRDTTTSLRPPAGVTIPEGCVYIEARNNGDGTVLVRSSNGGSIDRMRYTDAGELLFTHEQAALLGITREDAPR